MDDEKILDLYWERNEMALTATSEKYGGKLIGLTRKMVSLEDAQECVNDTYMAAWNHIPPTRPSYFFAWLAKVCRRFACDRIDWLNAVKRKAEVVELSSELSECLPDRAAEIDVEAVALGEILSVYLRGLTCRQRTIFLRRYWYGDSVKEIAKALGYTESNIKVQLFRMRQDLKRYLQKEDIWV